MVSAAIFGLYLQFNYCFSLAITSHFLSCDLEQELKYKSSDTV